MPSRPHPANSPGDTKLPVPPGNGTHPAPSSTDMRVVRAVRARIDAGHYVPGTRLTLTELRNSTGHSLKDLRRALEHLAATGHVVGRWQAPDPRADDHAVTRARDLLAAMIGHGAYPPGAPMPTRAALSTILLTEPADLARALLRLADEGVIGLSGRARPRVPPPQDDRSSPVVWPPGPDEVRAALPRPRRPGAGHDRAALHLVRCAARERFKNGVCAGPATMGEQEELQAETLSSLVATAYEGTAHREHRSFLPVRSAAARSMACNALPTNVPLYERLFRFTVLATSLDDLAEALAAAGFRTGQEIGIR
ncbi:GntR family transcriptional regulator [Streptomyces anulatus]|uniref:GntR family transcriptional regulator n=1 Tax=Streptomyces anulatus TaxID=1892 RepID=UPI0038689451